jgi:hypothetical protein
VLIDQLGSNCGVSAGSTRNQCQLALGVDGSLPAPTVLAPPLHCVPTKFIPSTTNPAVLVPTNFKCANAVTGEIGQGIYPPEQ